MLPLRSSAAALALLLTSTVWAAPLEISDATPPALAKRATACTQSSNCRALALPAHAQHTCASKKCSWKCNTGYTKVNSSCVKSRLVSSVKTTTTKKTTTTTTKKTTTTTKKATTTKARAADTAVPTVEASNLVDDALVGVSAFLGTNSDAIVSWFEPNSTRDSTNGHSWCLYPYNDNTPGFAPSLNTMLAAANGSADLARELFCGLEATIASAAGDKIVLYVADAFDDTWVRTPSSIDVVHPYFSTIFGKVTEDKNDVLKKAKWKWTGRRNLLYASRGVGNP